MRLSGTKTGSINQYRGLGDQLWDLGGARPSLDLNFAHSKDLTDATTGSNLIDFTRASSGTYVGSDGLIKTATTNLLLQSEDFSTTWTTTDLTVSANTTIAPDGKLTADTLTIGAGVAAVMPAQAVTLANSTTYTVSIYINSSQTCDIVRFRCTVGGSAYFTVSTKTWSDLGSGWTGGTYQELNGGWIRASMQFVAGPTDGGSRSFSFGGVTAAGGTTPDTGNTLIYWGAQLEQSSTVGEYVKTTSTINSAPRFDHDPTTGESLGLLVEESRTNLLTYSEELDNAVWTNGGTFTWTPSTDLAPDGSLTVDKPSVVFTWWGFYDATNLAFLSGYPAAFPFTVTSSWTRQSVTITAPAGCTSLRFYPGRPGGAGSYFYQTVTVTPGTTYTASAYYKLDSASSTVLVWGAQLEEGSLPTSYIPTTSSTVTRAADVASITGSNFSSWYRQDEGTVFVEAAVPIGVSSSRAILSIDDGSNTDRIQIRHNGTTARTYLVIDNLSTQFSAQLVGDSFPPGQYVKLAMASKANDFAAVKTFGELDTDTSGTMPTVNQLQIGLTPSNAQPCKPIKRITYWPVRLPDATLLNITT